MHNSAHDEFSALQAGKDLLRNVMQRCACVPATGATLKHCFGARFQHLYGESGTQFCNINVRLKVKYLAAFAVETNLTMEFRTLHALLHQAAMAPIDFTPASLQALWAPLRHVARSVAMQCPTPPLK